MNYRTPLPRTRPQTRVNGAVLEPAGADEVNLSVAARRRRQEQGSAPSSGTTADRPFSGGPDVGPSPAEIKSEPALSYADAFCIATAQRLDATVLTNDPEFESVDSIIKIHWLTQ